VPIPPPGGSRTREFGGRQAVNRGLGRRNGDRPGVWVASSEKTYAILRRPPNGVESRRNNRCHKVKKQNGLSHLRPLLIVSRKVKCTEKLQKHLPD
jgi:hypothetical protein